jgi:hypothetical protein
MNGSIDEKVMLKKSEKIDQIRLLVKLLDSLIADEKELRKLAPKNHIEFQRMSCSPMSAGHFYEFTLIEHTLLFFYLAGLTDFLKKVSSDPHLIEQAIEDEKVEPPEWKKESGHPSLFEFGDMEEARGGKSWVSVLFTRAFH